VLVKLGLIKLLQRKFDVCETASVRLRESSPRSFLAIAITDPPVFLILISAENNATIQCPVVPGVYEIVQTVELPKEIPKGPYPIPRSERRLRP
jgi:hypothetical protein